MTENRVASPVWAPWSLTGNLRWSKDGKLQQQYARRGEVFKQMYGREYVEEFEWRVVPTETAK